MDNAKFIYWETEDGCWLGYLEQYPDYRTQGQSFEELQENLRDLHLDLTSGAIPSPRRVGELEIA